MDEYAPLQGASNGQKSAVPSFHAQSLAVLVMSPLLTYVTILALFTFAYGDSRTICWLWTVVCGGMALLMLALPNKRPEGPMFYMQLGILCLVSTIIATVFGFYNWDRHMSWDAAYTGQRFYTNVQPTEPALSHLDAGKIVFSGDSRLNMDRVTGYKSQDGSTYCIVPVIDATPESKRKAEYFAAGVDCCKVNGGTGTTAFSGGIRPLPPAGPDRRSTGFSSTANSSFTCDEYDNPKAHSGLVYLKLFEGDLLTEFRKAAQMLAADSGIRNYVSQDAIFVKWVEEPDRAANGYQNAGISFFLGTSLVYLVLCIVSGFMLHFGRRLLSPLSQRVHRITKPVAV